MWPGFRFAKDWCAADSTEASMHFISAIRDALKIAEFALKGDRLS
jgi:hypothetical protein